MKPLHEGVPRDYIGNLKFRHHIYGLTDPDEQAAIRWACEQDLLFFVNVFVWQFNPNAESKIGPFIAWESADADGYGQDDFLLDIDAAITEGEDLLVEKSREMGASWGVLIVMLRRWLFRRYEAFLLISRSQEAVDVADVPDCLMWKLDFILEHLPEWMLPKGFDPDLHRKKNLLRNPETKSVITGTASTAKAGVGGRSTAILVDEFAQIREDSQVLSRTSDTSKCRIFVSTHMGVETAFFNLCRRPDMKKIRLHWTLHPEKCKGLYRSCSPVEVLDTDCVYPPDFVFVVDGTPAGGPRPGIRSPWYDKQCKRKTSTREVAIDIDIDPEGSSEQFFDPLVIRDLQDRYGRDPMWRGELDYDRDTGRLRGLVPHSEGRVRLWLMPDRNMKLPGSVYTAGADIAAGTGATPSCFSGIDAVRGMKVLEYANPFISPDEFAPIAVALCWLLADKEGHGAYFCWENAGGVGVKFGQSVLKLGYRRIWYNRGEENTWGKPSEKPGWYPSDPARFVLFSDYRAALANRMLVNPSVSSLADTLGFHYDGRGGVKAPEKTSVNDDPSGAGQNHADMATADALAWKLAMPYSETAAEARETKTEIAGVGSPQWCREFWANLERDKEPEHYWRS